MDSALENSSQQDSSWTRQALAEIQTLQALAVVPF